MIDSEDAIRVEIIDEGKGIPESELPYIWSRYYKIDKGFTRTTSSTGLGLAIAKAILEAHGAKYGVTSKVNVGSTFYFESSKDYDEKSVSTKDWHLLWQDETGLTISTDKVLIGESLDFSEGKSVLYIETSTETFLFYACKLKFASLPVFILIFSS